MVDRLPATEPVTITPPRRVSTPTIRQEWKEVAFVHWPIEPAAVGRLLPRHVRPDVLDGTTYVGLIGLRIRTSLGGVLPVPWLGTFDETHLRLYSVDGTGHRGGVFLTLNADRLITAAFARSVLRIPYTWSPSTIDRRDDVMTYATTRRWPNRPTTLRFAVRIGEPCPDPTPLERFVTARWSMHSSWLGQTMRVDVTHPSWPLFRAELVDLELPRSFLDEVGLARPDRAPASVLWSPGVRSNLGWPVPV